MARNPNKKRCKAKSKRTGKQCKNWATPGYDACRFHGSRGGAPKGNQNSKKHGFFSKYIPEETLEIMNGIGEVSPADLIWDQIVIQYAAIIRAQQIMYVEDKDEIVKVLKKEKETDFGSEEEWELQFAWDRHATFLNAQSRAMSELRSLIKQFNDLAHENDERKLKLQLMQANIDKVKAETENLTGSGESNAVDDWVAAMSDIDE